MGVVALRDQFRSSVLGLAIRSLVVERYRRHERLDRARRAERTDPKRFTCPVCGYCGIFIDKPGNGVSPARQYAVCPDCGAAERHRLQCKVLEAILPEVAGARKSALHFAPESFIRDRLKPAFGEYRTADLFRRDVDIRADMTELPIGDNSFDLVYASHVLEHIPDDRKAMGEIRRVLRPGGVAVLPVPIHSDGPVPAQRTVEYDAPKPEEDGHIRAPGLDYFERQSEFFDVKLYPSEEFLTSQADHQLFIRALSAEGSCWVYPDYVPVCFKR